MSDKATLQSHLRLVEAPAGVDADTDAGVDSGAEVDADAKMDTDADVAAALARGDRDVLQVVYLQHHAAVRAFSRRLLGDDAAAEDVVHEVFVSLPRAIRSWRRAGALRSFLLALAVNTGRHHLRAVARRRAVQARLARESTHVCAPAPDRTIEREQLAALLQSALDELPADQRIAFVLAEVEERSAAEGAAIMRVREGTFRARVFLARRKLRARLGDVAFGEEHP